MILLVGEVRPGLEDRSPRVSSVPPSLADSRMGSVCLRAHAAQGPSQPLQWGGGYAIVQELGLIRKRKGRGILWSIE